jgi:two-component system, chemotaxis family, sensor kinase CheA
VTGWGELDIQRFLRLFLEEASEHIATLEGGLLAMEQTPDDRELIDGVFRAAHSIKGGSSSVGLADIAQLTHAMESLLDRMRTGAQQTTPALTGLLLRSTDELRELVAAVRDGGLASSRPSAVAAELDAALGGGATPNSAGRTNPSEPELWIDETYAAPAPPPGSEAPVEPAAETRAKAAPTVAVESSTLRVAIDKVDRLINLVGELVIAQSMISEVARNFAPDKLARLQEAVGQMERNTRELQERVMAVRMVPVSSVFSRLPRLARDLSGALGKQVRVEIAGGETELDKGMVERIGDPLTHLVRNAIDHGIESPADRLRTGKPEHGTLQVRAFHQGGNVVIEIEDDGRGLDAEKIRSKAAAVGLIKADDQLSPEAIQELIFRPGFSTAEQVTDVSGRGVGMDVVRTNIESLNGSISLDSQAGRGTRLRISLPLTLAIIDGLCVSVAEEVYIVPLVAIVQSFRPRPEDVRTIAGRGEVVCVRGQVLPLLRLRRLFAVARRQDADAEGIVVIVENQGVNVGLLVDDIVGQAQVVIKSLEANFRRVEGVMGATIMGDGRVGLILDVQGLTRIGRGPATTKPPSHERRVGA